MEPFLHTRRGSALGFTFDYGTASSSFGLSSAPYFTVPYQYNTSTDGVISGDIEYLIARRPLQVGIAFKGSFAFSGWDLGSPGVYDSVGNYYYPDDVRISANWWALAALATAHLHLGRYVTIDGAFGYGPYGYFNVNYQDDSGVVYGPVSRAPACSPGRHGASTGRQGFPLGSSAGRLSVSMSE